MTKPLHLIHVIPNESGGGAERLVCDLHIGLTGAGFSCERVHFCGAPVDEPGVTRFGRSQRSLVNVLLLRRLLKSRLAQGQHRIVLHSHLVHGFYIAAMASAGLPVIRLHTEHSTTNSLRQIRALRGFQRWVYQRCAAIVAISAGVAASLQRDLGLEGKQVKLIHNGARFFGAEPRCAPQDRALRFVSVGSLSHRKGFDLALRGLAAAPIGDWVYHIIGEGPERGPLTALIDSLGLAGRVHLLGWADPQPWLQQADLQLIPSRYEGFGLVAVEGMSTGLRLIASDVEGLREVIGQDERIAWRVADHENPEAWRLAIEQAAADLRQTGVVTSEAALARAAQFSRASMIEDHAGLYRGL